jgi:hypothetical protein
MLGLGAGTGMFAGKAASRGDSVFEISLAGFEKALLPREHGQLTSSFLPVRRRYPSREHCMQMAAFFGPDGGLLVYVNDSSTPPSEWTVSLGNRLQIEFFGNRPEVVVKRIEPTVTAAAAGYREWAIKQPWVTERLRGRRDLNLISVASNPNINMQRRHLEDLFGLVPRPVGAWFTQWRRFPFDAMYPDYAAGDPVGFARLLTDLRHSGCTTFPYMNALLWDARLAAFARDGSDIAVIDRSGEQVQYNSKLNYLRYACPFSAKWQRVLTAARNAIRDSEGIESEGVYLDMLLAVPPIACWSARHGHEPGDTSAWLVGVKELLRNMPGVIMTEGCAEPFLAQVDHVLMHLYTQDGESVPLWSQVYGDIISPVGWRIPDQPTGAIFSAELAKAKAFGNRTMASPWMTPLPESSLLTPAVRAVIRNSVHGRE